MYEHLFTETTVDTDIRIGSTLGILTGAAFSCFLFYTEYRATKERVKATTAYYSAQSDQRFAEFQRMTPDDQVIKIEPRPDDILM